MEVTVIILTAQHSTAQHSTAQHSTAQHSTAQHSTFFSTVHIPKRIKEPINMYMDKMYVFIETFLSNKEDNLI